MIDFVYMIRVLVKVQFIVSFPYQAILIFADREDPWKFIILRYALSNEMRIVCLYSV